MSQVTGFEFELAGQTRRCPPFIWHNAKRADGSEGTVLSVDGKLTLPERGKLITHLRLLTEKPVAGCIQPTTVKVLEGYPVTAFERFDPKAFSPELVDSLGGPVEVIRRAFEIVANVHAAGFICGAVLDDSFVIREGGLYLADLCWMPLLELQQVNAMATCMGSMPPELSGGTAVPSITTDVWSVGAWATRQHRTLATTVWAKNCASGNPALRPRSVMESWRILEEELARLKTASPFVATYAEVETPKVEMPTVESKAPPAFESEEAVRHEIPSVTQPTTSPVTEWEPELAPEGIIPKNEEAVNVEEEGIVPKDGIYTPTSTPITQEDLDPEIFASGKEKVRPRPTVDSSGSVALRRSDQVKAKVINVIILFVGVGIAVGSYFISTSFLSQVPK
ncbi:MAG TPA: hypothetical protein VGL56_09250 [Fimbriimonadaceae bacterium]|jgi:hypothetical protein